MPTPTKTLPLPLLAIPLLLIIAACQSELTPTPISPTAPPAHSATPTPPPTSIPAALPEPTTASTPTPRPMNPTDPMRLFLSTDGQTLTFDNRPVPPPLDIYALAHQFLPNADLSPPAAPRDAVGDERSFFAYNLRQTSRTRIDAVLCASTQNADFYLQRNLGLTCAAFDDAVTRRFEEQIRPSVIANFAGDQAAAEKLRIALVHADVPGFGGYFDASDLYPTAVNPYASGRYTLYLNATRGGIGNPRNPGYHSVVAHELQHAVHELSDPNEATWVNEGLSVLAEGAIASITSANYFLDNCPPTHVMAWPPTTGAAACHYAGAGLIMRYIRDNYPDSNGALRQLVAEPANGLRGIDAYLDTIGANVDALKLLTDWGVANYLDGRSNRDSYRDFDARATATSQIDQDGELSLSLTQFAAEYVALPLKTGVYTISFQGETATPLAPNLDGVSGSFWYAGSEDSTAYALTREFDLRSAGTDDDANLTLLLRHDTEENWDYLYATASTDGGQTWQTLRSPSMDETSEIAVGSTMFGAGFSGKSGDGVHPQWILEEIDLSDFAGERVLFRLLYLTDQSISLDGVSLGGAWLPAAGYGWAAVNHPLPSALVAMTTNEQRDGGWQPDGFFFTNNRVQQDYAVGIMTVARDGAAFVSTIPIRGQSGVAFTYDNSDGDIVDAAIMIMPFAPQTRQPARATLTAKSATVSET